RLLNKKWAIVASLLLLTTPIIFIQSHLALDNLMPVPFALIWLLFLYLYDKEKKLKYLFIAGVSLGVNFYSYKAMRGVVPFWIVLTTIYLCYGDMVNRKITKRLIKEVSIFILGILPFFIIIPYLKATYPGAVFAGYRPHGIDWNDFFYTYLANLDLSFLFIKGDSTVYHSTGKHGMMLLATLPLFLVGCYKSVKEGKFWRFILAVFFLTPVVFSFAGSFFRASRLLSIVPAYILLTTLGAKYVFKYNKIIFLIITVAIIANFYNFVNYYWYTYPKFVQGYFSQTKEASYKIFSEEAKGRNLKPYINQDLYNSDGEIAHFFEAVFFRDGAVKIKIDEELPKDGILMTYREGVPGLKRLDVQTPNYYIQIDDENN
ncbi:MAG: glycosyltransferase family 39 protein, partial [Patescibacteria group bacterium]